MWGWIRWGWCRGGGGNGVKDGPSPLVIEWGWTKWGEIWGGGKWNSDRFFWLLDEYFISSSWPSKCSLIKQVLTCIY